MKRVKEVEDGDTITLEEAEARLEKRKNKSPPEPLRQELIATYAKMESLIVTLEVLEDPLTLKDLEMSRRQLAHGGFTECSIDEVDTVLR